jgi:cytochrome c oxidase cbb3-type subunit 2
MNRKARILVVALGVLVTLTTGNVACQAQDSHIGSLTGKASSGQVLYRRYCIGCHGLRGDGVGENAPWVDPKPRDFTAAVFKCRSTASGSIPLDSDLYDTISRGLHSSAMPSWYPLPRQQRADLIAYVKTFSHRFREEKPEPVILIPPETPASPASIERGKDVFQKMECWKCHGQSGRGNGPAAATLVDTKGNAITPYDFTTGDRFKCGDSDRDLYRIFMTGLDGTPMPSFADNLKPDQAWDLVHYLRTLQMKKTVAKATSGP